MDLPQLHLIDQGFATRIRGWMPGAAPSTRSSAQAC